MAESEITYSTVLEWDTKRVAELSKKYDPYIKVTDAYASLVCEIVDVIGKHRPKSVQDRVVRDLLADVFDALHEARRIILTGKCHTAYPIARRVYESQSLMALCVLDAAFATKWDSGKEIPNRDVRRELAKHPFGETEDSTRGIYKFFSSGSHPNRELVPGRLLGEGNEFVLGAFPRPSIAMVTEYCMLHLKMWFWFTAALIYFYHDLVDPVKPDFGKRYLHVADAAQELIPQLDANFRRLLKEEQAYHAQQAKS